MTVATPADILARFRGEPDQMIDVGAGHVAHRRFGRGPDVVFVHGWPVSGATFRRLVPHLADHLTCHVIDLPGAGSSTFSPGDPVTMDQHVISVRRVVDHLGLDDIAVVGHDSGGMIARHALAGDPRVRSFSLINSETPAVGWRFRSFLMARHLPGLAGSLGWICGSPRVRRIGLVFGDALEDRSHLDGEFDELFLAPIHRDADRRRAAAEALRTFDLRLIRELPDVHRRISVPVQLVWGDRDPFFPIEQARAMVETFPDARLDVISGGRLFCHEERPAEVAAALLGHLRPR